MKKIFSFTKKKKNPSGTPDSGSVLSVGYDLKDKDLGKVHKAASVGDLAKLKQLAKKNDINQLDKENRTALHIACASGHVEVVQFLVESKAKLNLCDNQNRSALMKAVQGQHERCVNILLENHAEPNLIDINGNTALHLAANIPSISTARLLLEHEADLNAPNKEGFTPLSVAVREDHIEMAEFLLKEGADVNFTGQEERSPLMMAAGNGQIAMLRLLLRYDADITLKDSKGWSADDYAVMNGHHPCSLLIIEHGTQKNDGSSLLHQDGSKKKKKILLGSPSHDAEAGFSLGGPATDKDDFEDNSQSESLSRVSKSAAEEWPSSDNDEESVSIEKKPQRVNLRKMIATKKGEASAQPDRSLSGVESEPESENVVQRIPSFPKVTPSSNAVQHPVDPYPDSFLSKAPQMTSTPLPSYRKVLFYVRLHQLHFYNTFLFSSEMHKQADHGADQEKRKHSEQPSSSKAKSGGSPEAEDSEEEEEEEEEDDDDDEEEEEEEDEDDDDEEEDDDDEEDEDDEEEDEEDEGEEDEEDEGEEDNECEEDDDKCVASVEAAGFVDIPKPSPVGNLKKTNSADTQKTINTDILKSNVSSPDRALVGESVNASENAAKTETQTDDSGRPGETSHYAIPVTLGIEEDCIVSAIRVESKFSDEDDSVGKDCVWTPGQNVTSGRGSAGGPKTSNRKTLLPINPEKSKKEKVKEDDDEDDDDDNSWGKKQDTGDTVWNDSDDEEHQTGGLGHNTVLGKRRNIVPEHSHSDVEDLSNEEGEKKRRSSWGSSLDSDPDLANDDQVNEKIPEQKSDLKATKVFSEDALPQPSEDHHDTSRDTPRLSSSKCVSPQHVMGKPVSPLKLSSASTSRRVMTPAKAAADESDWDSSSESHDIKLSRSPNKKEPPSVSGEPRGSAVSFSKKDDDAQRKKSHDPSPTVSPAKQKLQDSKSLKDDSNWDDDDDDEDDCNQEYMPTSPSQNKGQRSQKNTVALSKPHETKGNKGNKNIPLSTIDVNDHYPETGGLEEEKPVGVKKDHPSKDDETDEDSDSMDKKLQYDFFSSTMKMSGVEDDSVRKGAKLEEEQEARLISYVQLQTQRTVATETASVAKLREVFSGPLTKDNGTAGQQTDSDENTFSDEALPQTDIDDVDIDSPDESLGMKCPEVRNTEEYPKQKDDSTEDEDDQNDDKDDEEDDISEDDEQPEGSGDSRDAISPIPEGEVCKDKKRDFLSELGLDRGDGEQESWDSESGSENPKLPHEENQNVLTKDQEEMPALKEDIKETVDSSKADNGEAEVDKDDTPQKETEKAKWEPLLSKLEGGSDRKTDLMEELGLGDVDDLEDASDWDSASTTSKRTLPGRRVASPGLEEFPESFSSPIKEEGKGIFPTATLTPQSSIRSDKRSLPTPSQTAPHPQPRARKIVPQKPESQEDSDWESDNLTSPSKTEKTDNHSQETVDQQTEVRPDSAELTQKCIEVHVDAEGHQQKEGDDTVDVNQLDVDAPCPSGHASSDNDEQDHDLRDQHSPEDHGDVGADVPWENRYEKLWVEVEKREMKSTFKSVAGELRARFGELFKSNQSTAGDTEQEQDQAECSPVEDDSSDEEEGEVIVRPTARARSTVLLTIPEQRESGLEDSVTESADHSLCEDRKEVCAASGSETNKYREPEQLTDEESRSSSPQPPMEDFDYVATDGHAVPMTVIDHYTLVEDSNTLPPFSEEQLEENKNNNSGEAELKNNNVSSEEDPEEFTEPYPTPLGRSAFVPGVSDEELEEDMERFKLEVGMLKVVFLDLEKEKAQLQKEIGKGSAKTALKEQKSSASWDTGGIASEDVGAEKLETMLGCRKEMSSQTALLEQQPADIKSTNGAPVQLQLPLQQAYIKNKQDVQAVEEPIQLELVRGAQRSRAPQTNTHINGDPLSVFDDTSLSEVSDDEGRMPTEVKEKNESPDEVEMAEDFDELTQSSDTATDDLDSPTAGYRHASLLIQKLDSATLDSRSMVKLQNIFHEYERSIQKLKSRHGYLADKVSQLEIERVELKSSLDEMKDVKSALERNQLELQTEVTNLKFQLKQEQENRRNATMMYNTTKDKLKRTEEHQQFEVQERQKVELTLRNLELEMRTLVNNMKQLEEDHSETQRLLAQERSARALQESLLNSHLRKQQEIEQESKRNISRSNEALTQLTEASDREKELLQQTATLQDQVTILRADLERSQASSSLKESHLLEENDGLKEHLEEARQELKINSEALTQTVFNCNNQLTGLKSELNKMTAQLENERQNRETLEAEVESVRTRLAGAVQEAERCLAAHADTEKALLREKEETQRLKDRLSGEVVSQRDTVSSLSQKLSKAEAQTNSMENEVHRVTLQLTEKGLLLDVLQKEKDQVAVRVKELEIALQAEKELVTRSGARHEATQERLAQAQSDVMLLRQQVEEVQNKGDAKERAVTDAQERFSDILAKLRSDCEERVQLVEERNKELASKAADLRDQIYKFEEEKNERETSLRQMQQELADSLKKLSMSEASLEVNTRYRSDLEEEKGRFLKDMDRLKGKLEESEDQYVQAEKRINALKSSLDEREKELTTAAHKLQEALSASAVSDTTVKQLEEAVQKLEIENARLEAATKQQSNKIDALQKGAQEAAMVRGHLEDLVTNLQSSKMTLEDQLSREVQKQSMLSHTAQDSQALWEEELKSRSKLGLRLAELEKEKGELTSQMEIEKKKAKKIAEQKKSIDSRLEQEMNRNTELQKEMYRLRTLLKTAKKKLRDQDMGGAEFGSPMGSLRMDMGRYGQADGRMKEKVDDLQMQLERETSRRSQLEKANDELKDQLASLKRSNHSSEQLERSKHQQEEELLELRRRLETAQAEQSQVDHVRRDAEERARQEIQQKLEQVNLFLQTQAASQEALDQLKAANEANLRSQLEHKIRELENELGRVRTTQQDSLNQREMTRTELDRYRQLYGEELRLRKSLAAKLERSNSRLSEANSKLLSERSKSLIASSFANSSLGGPSLDGDSLRPLNRSLGLGLSLLNPVSEGQSSRVEDYLAKMQSELDRNISKELSSATAELDVASARMSPVGSASWVDLDPLSRAKQQYLEVLKKNHRV